MSGLFTELSRTSQALNAQSQGVFTSGRNMANVNNPAYARQRVQLGDRGMVNTPLGAQSLGVEAIALQNVRDVLLDRQLLRETSFMTSLEAEADAYYKAELALGQQIDRQSDAAFVEGAGQNGDSNGIGAALTNLLNAFGSLASNPRSEAERQIVFQKAQSLVSQFHAVDGRLDALQNDIGQNIQSDVGRVNGLLQVISDVNKQIARFEAGNAGSALDLRDQRQAKLEELSKYLDFQVEDVPGSIGQIRIVSQDAADNPVVLLDSGNPFAPLSFDGSSVSAGTTTLRISGGMLSGRLAARDGAISDLRSGLGLLASQVVASVNAAYNPGGASTNFFAAGSTTAATIALDPTLSSATLRASNTGNPGANEAALALADLGLAKFSTGSGDGFDGSFDTFYLSLVSGIANATSTANTRLEDQTTIQRLIFERRESVSGVSLDEEMAELVKYQRAFDASARVMRVIDELLETVVNGLVR